MINFGYKTAMVRRFWTQNIGIKLNKGHVNTRIWV